jgi:hypothetical protein
VRWIILSRNNPASLHACLDSGKEFLPGTKPDVVVPDDEPHALVASRFPAFRFVSGRLSHLLQAIVSDPKPNGAPEQMTLITTDDMLWVSKPRIIDAWTVLRDHNDVAAVSLRFPPEGTTLYAGPRWFHWDAKVSPPFPFGVIYRTNDLIGPLYHAEYDSPLALRSALCDDPALRRRPKMACLPVPSMENLFVDDPSATQRYLGGEIIDRAALVKEKTRCRFKMYEET